MPYQAVCNKLEVYGIPEELSCLNKLETILIAQQISFQKILIMHKGQQKKIRGAVCNVPVYYDTVCKSLPRPLIEKYRRSVNAMVSDSFPGQFLFNM